MTVLSVIIPTYNCEATIDRCLKSLAAQTFSDFEICIVDGHSSDQTLAQTIQFCPYFKSIKIISESDQGTYDAMNKGIDIASGEWLYFLGSDDELYDPSVLSDIFYQDIPSQYGVAYGNVRIGADTPWSKAGQIYDGFFDLDRLLSKNICHQAIFYRKSTFQRFGRYKTQYRICADWEVNLRFFSKTEFMYCDRTIANFCGGGISSQNSFDPIANDLDAIRKRTRRSYKFRKFASTLGFS